MANTSITDVEFEQNPLFNLYYEREVLTDIHNWWRGKGTGKISLYKEEIYNRLGIDGVVNRLEEIEGEIKLLRTLTD